MSTRLKTQLERWRRNRVKKQFEGFFAEASAILYRHDPTGINFGDNTYEYDPEAGTILPRLSGCRSAADVQKIVFKEFCKWFNPETAGDETRYEAIAADLWAAWSARR